MFIISGILLLADEKKIPEKPSNIPEDAEWSAYGWKYQDYGYTSPSILWYQKGNLYRLFYDTEDKKYYIDDYYYENGKVKRKDQNINFNFLREDHKKITDYSFDRCVGKQTRYHENGKVKEERCYTFRLKKGKTLENVMCGSEIFYDESGKEIKRIEHDVECEYGCAEVPRTSAEKLIAQVKSYKDKSRNRSLGRLPVIGQIVSVGSWSKNLEVVYKTGFELIPGDQICCLIDGDIVSFECKSNDNGKGIFELKEDKGKKYSSVNEKSEPRFYKKNEVKYAEVLKSGKPKAGDVKVIGGIEFVYIPAGHDSGDPQKPSDMDVKAFWMTKYEVTLGEFLKYSYEVGKNFPVNSKPWILDSRYPAVMEAYNYMAREFCEWFGKKHGVDTDIPNRDEWEYAARAGTDTDYYWGNDKIDDYAWYKKNSGGKLHPVGQKKPNAWGLYDMIGNAWEWADAFGLRGGGYGSDTKELQYRVNYQIYSEYWDEHDMSNPYKSITDQGTGFRMIILVP
jgi:hypothetical protein